VARVSRITIIISNCLYVFFVSSVECSFRFVLYILVGSLDISFGRYHFCAICLFMDAVYVLYCVLDSKCYFYICVLK
jgi:hypothetical protein